MIWHKKPELNFLNQKFNVGLSKFLKMEFTEIGDDYLKMKMEVDSNHWQPYGVLNGGASVALAETVGSSAANMVVDTSQYAAVGQEINANHIRAFKEGTVIGTAKPIHMGKRSHVWEIQITNEQDELICISRLTMAIIDTK